MAARPLVLCIDAVDTTGEQGVVADAIACNELGCRPVHVSTSLVAVPPGGAPLVEQVPPAILQRQFETLALAGRPAAARVGLVTGLRQIQVIAETLRGEGLPNVVVAPVLRIGGSGILEDGALRAIRDSLFPLARVLVVRATDLGSFRAGAADGPEGALEAASGLRAGGVAAVLVAGIASGGRVLDLLDDGGKVSLVDASRIRAPRVPGLVAAHATALACFLARGETLPRALDAAQRFVASSLIRGAVTP